VIHLFVVTNNKVRFYILCSQQTLDSFIFQTVPVIQDTPKNPCNPSPCGPFSQCREDSNNLAICSCLQNYQGSPPNCKPECSINADCPNVLSCQNQKCKDPCLGSCGYGAECLVSNHNANCICPSGTTGDPFENCHAIVNTRKNLETQFSSQNVKFILV
jgi:hypothetical protein